MTVETLQGVTSCLKAVISDTCLRGVRLESFSTPPLKVFELLGRSCLFSAPKTVYLVCETVEQVRKLNQHTCEIAWSVQEGQAAQGQYKQAVIYAEDDSKFVCVIPVSQMTQTRECRMKLKRWVKG